MREFSGKVAVVTGAGSGIGRALALRFAQEKMRIVLAGLDADALEESARLVRDAGAEAAVRQLDVSRRQDVEGLADFTYATFGSCSILCNNAGVFAAGAVWERPVADYEWSLDVHLWAIIHALRSFVPRMLAEDREGHIVNTLSAAALFPPPFCAPYNVSKIAAFGVTESLATDLMLRGSKIKVTALCPVLVATDITKTRRYRPERYAAPPMPDDDEIEKMLAETTARGCAPSVVAERAFRAIVEEKFLIASDEKILRFLEERGRTLAQGDLPFSPLAQDDGGAP